MMTQAERAKGDTLWDIAKKYLGSGARYTEIVKLNSLGTIFSEIP